MKRTRFFCLRTPRWKSLQDFLPRVGQLEGHQAAAHQGGEGQKDGDGFGDPHEAGEDGGAKDGGQLTERVQDTKRCRPATKTRPGRYEVLQDQIDGQQDL